MKWIYEFVEQAFDQYRDLDAEERKGLRDELAKVIEDHNLGRVPRHGKTEKMKGRENVFRLKAWPRRALFRTAKRPTQDAAGKPILDAKGKPVLEGVIEVYSIEPRDKVYKKK